MAPSSVVSAITTNGSFSRHSFIWSRCVLFPRTKGSTHAHASLPPSLHPSMRGAAHGLPACPPARPVGGYSNKTMHSNGRTPTQKEAEAFVSAFARPEVGSLIPTDHATATAIVIILINGAYGRRHVSPFVDAIAATTSRLFRPSGFS